MLTRVVRNLLICSSRRACGQEGPRFEENCGAKWMQARVGTYVRVAGALVAVRKILLRRLGHREYGSGGSVERGRRLEVKVAALMHEALRAADRR